MVDGVGVGFVPCFCGVSSGESDFGIGVCFNELFPEDRTRDVRHGLVDASISSKKYMGALYSVISKQTFQSLKRGPPSNFVLNASIQISLCSGLSKMIG